MDDYRLAFTRYSTGWGSGVADVVSSSGAHVWGRLYLINTQCLAALDLKESFGTGYTRFECKVTTTNGESYVAITYTVIDKVNKTSRLQGDVPRRCGRSRFAGCLYDISTICSDK